MFVIAIKAKGLEKLPERLKRFRIGIIARQTRMLQLAGEAVRAKSVEHYLSGPRPEKLGRVSGDLAKSVGYRVSGNRVVIGSNLTYARIHEFGGVIVPKRAKRLVFRLLDGSWRSALRVVIPERPFLRPALQDAKPEVRSIIQRLANEALREVMA
jgi:phage gpG-like protein